VVCSFVIEVFVHNLPQNKNVRKIQRKMAIAVKRACGSAVAFDWRQFTAKKALGSLTFPTYELGNRFLAHHRDGFTMYGNTVYFLLSKNHPNERLVEGLNMTMADRTMADMEFWHSDSEDERFLTHNTHDLVEYHLTRRYDANYAQRGVPFKAIEWGVWTADGTFAIVEQSNAGG
jgi:hypothetical protein